MPSSTDVRDALTDSLVLDLVGPTTADHPLATELLPQGPSRWYLTGFLVPVQSDAGARTDPESVEDVDAVGERGGTDDAVTPEPAAAGTTFLPSSMGMSLLVSGATKRLGVEVSWGDYRRESVDGDGGKKRSVWRRVPQRREMEIDVPPATPEPRSIEVPESGGLRIALSVRPVDGMGLPGGTRSVSVFLVNDRRPVDRDDPRRDETFVFQAELRVRATEPLVPRPDMRGHDT